MKRVFVAKLWGHELHVINNMERGYCLKQLTVDPTGNACSIHYHVLKTETFWVRSGALLLEVFNRLEDEQVFRDEPKKSKLYLRNRAVHVLMPGALFTIETQMPHRFWTTGSVPAVFLEVSTPDRADDSYRIVDAGPIPN
jgi:mannose-6-phosphate isomerase-like protein (cupin superfamily)